MMFYFSLMMKPNDIDSNVIVLETPSRPQWFGHHPCCFLYTVFVAPRISVRILGHYFFLTGESC